MNKAVSRREFLKTSGGVALFIGVSGILPQMISCKNKKEVQGIIQKHPLTAWVQLTDDGRIIIFNPAAEMGQGSMTSLPAIFAEEMDADWSMVSVEFSPQESDIYGSDKWSPNQKVMLSAGSRITYGYYSIMRQAGAQARYILMHSAAEHWKVPLAELSTANGEVIDNQAGKRISYGDLIPYLVMPDNLPEFSESDFKDPKNYRFIGIDQPRVDIPEKVMGTAQFAIDIQLPQMLYGVLERGKVHGASPTLNNESEILSLDGVVKLVRFDYAIGIIAETIDQALAAKKLLNISWSEALSSGFNSQECYKKYEKIASDKATGKVIIDEGDIKSAIKSADQNFTADFKNDYVYHAQMEPLNSVVQVGADGKSAEVWVGSQQGFDSKLGIPKYLGIPAENVKINLQYLGGGFGRRSMTDFVLEGTGLAREVAPRPVKLIWTREDDVSYGAYRPLTLQRLRAAADAQGNITGFSHCVVGDGGNLVASGIRIDYYDIPNIYAEWREVSEGIRLKHWRSVGHGPNKFAIECMIDEIAAYFKKDPADLRRKLLAKSPRALATLEKAIAISDWGSAIDANRAKGIAFLERSGTLSTGVCEISVDRTTGKITVHHFWSANDAGIVIQPDNVKAQMEGGIIMGISSVLKEQLTIVNGKVQQSNFSDYQILRIEDIPDSIETAIIESKEPPRGVGESGTPLVACAIANAFLKLTGKPLRHLPFTPERVLNVLNT
ncbi:molybdopterin cofactor-binding domain-containing protein [uncultured Eudoraea sp.]|uniref:xanthine dehydrogenase family protein molybdopterin-binding subunit n=1 Tax=uncultured Eudoraea sp. TaxID=1035614 RepID=UPI002629152C|nr:molybdopterin cofactor-binding domain-containing protein [uncultured Eudoraea sp.]